MKSYPRFYQMLLNILNRIGYFDLRFNLFFPNYKITDVWRQRTDLVKQCPDNDKIDKVPEAGKIFRHYQVMHNGLKITPGSYYDYGNTILLRENQGVHEPQEEYVFQEALRKIPARSTIMELGSFWAFYSSWFASQVKLSRCIMIEPDPHKMNFGQLNFKLNGLSGNFDLGFISDEAEPDKRIPTYSVDYLTEKYNIDFLDVLHSDIQGFELRMLHGAHKALSAKKIGLLFISTHSNELHQQCQQLLESSGYITVCSANLDESYSWDGLLVSRADNYLKDFLIEISKRPKG